MRNAFRIGLLLALFVYARAAMAQDPVFLSALEDVPLMAGLEEATEETVNFNTPSGRIVETYAVGTVTKASVFSYYKESLPSLGWQLTPKGTFMREGEYLSITVTSKGGTSTVRFALSPDAK